MKWKWKWKVELFNFETQRVFEIKKSRGFYHLKTVKICNIKGSLFSWLYSLLLPHLLITYRAQDENFFVLLHSIFSAGQSGEKFHPRLLKPSWHFLHVTASSAVQVFYLRPRWNLSPVIRIRLKFKSWLNILK